MTESKHTPKSTPAGMALAAGSGQRRSPPILRARQRLMSASSLDHWREGDRESWQKTLEILDASEALLRIARHVAEQPCTNIDDIGERCPGCLPCNARAALKLAEEADGS